MTNGRIEMFAGRRVLVVPNKRIPHWSMLDCFWLDEEDQLMHCCVLTEEAERMGADWLLAAGGRLASDKHGRDFDLPAIRAELSAPPAPEATETGCPDCEGNGFTLRSVNECCGHGTPSGDCCGDPVPGQEQVGCERCQTTGKVATPPAPEATDGN